MRRIEFLLPALAILAQCVLFADGGAVRLRKQTSEFVITVFTARGPQGATDFSVLVQNLDGLDPVLDANILLILEDSSGTVMTARPTHNFARNKLLYAVPVIIPKSGIWQMTVVVDRNRHREHVSGKLEVASSPEERSSYTTCFAIPPVAIALFVIRHRLIRRKGRRARPEGD
jgi:hypothetical protein